jgi:hypothetical protein
VLVDEFTAHEGAKPVLDGDAESSEFVSSELVSSDSVLVGVVMVGTQVASPWGEVVPGMVKAPNAPTKPTPAKALMATPAVRWLSFRTPAVRAPTSF